MRILIGIAMVFAGLLGLFLSTCGGVLGGFSLETVTGSQADVVNIARVMIVVGGFLLALTVAGVRWLWRSRQPPKVE
jgi:hypothetical protein